MEQVDSAANEGRLPVHESCRDRPRQRAPVSYRMTSYEYGHTRWAMSSLPASVLLKSRCVRTRYNHDLARPIDSEAAY